ncbi:family 61 glycoside hydrolase [Cryphonectria parasitica EP155]|uniref:lytic cellulose monooxygenase (C4-dehydrogenating) n=1 Tax=Cryphonectria parasitica (strain ATCC 38755 / EP155) TaxID=660469 RepID=A0A9P5CLE4_CRYP1|nr:family 61 glycoside hydrolase [Cryphonectria parasitica EP155]KAF3762978.1 family 61 glycoside hydrolase [Cryphonectria parasitica EP155]
MVSKFQSTAILLGALAGTALGHGHVTGIVADGVYYGGFSLDYYYEKENTGTFTESVGWWAEDLDNGYIAPSAYNTSDIICHLDGQPANLTATVKAGGTVEFQWTAWPHPGPVLTYVALCPGDCTDPTMDKTALEWVKIDEGGFDVPSQTWASYDLIANNNSWTSTVPSDLAAGNYVFRHEIIAVHGSESLNGAQNYPQCVNIQVTGSGTTSPSGTLGTELYHETDPGIYFNPYTTLLNYTIPGPALMEGGTNQTVTATTGAAAATSAASSAASTSAAAAVTTSAAATSSSAAAAAATTSSAAAVAATTSSTAPETTAAAATSSSAAAAETTVAVAAASTSVSSAASAATTTAKSSCSKKRRHARDVSL